MDSVPASTPSHPDIRLGRKSFVVTVLAVYLAMFVFSGHSFTTLQMTRLLVAGGVYLLVGLYGAELYARLGSSLILALLYAIEIPLAGLIVYWTIEFFLAGLIMLPLASLSVQVLPRRWMLIICAVLIIALAASYGLHGGLEAALLAGIGYLAAIVFVVFITQMAMREWKARAEAERLAVELAAANRKLREYAAQAEMLAVTQERARLAHEIHDTLGHTLTALDVQLELLIRLPPSQTEQRQQAAEEARALVREGLTDMRRAVQALRPAALETFSLPEAIAGLVADFEQATHIHTAWQVKGEVAPLPLCLALPLYRAAQEALTNIRRHATEAQQVTVQLRYDPEEVVLSVENDGVPPSPAPVVEREGGGHGLRGLRERAEALGGEFSARPDETGGFRLEMRLPVA
ncbi:MAG TPA: sensor histidine kinase [Thermoflexia bacterium]|nr:sensor histidine kinase [Thermoflexia bacterium]